MQYVALGVVAFIMAGLFDLAALNRIRYLKQVLGLAAVLLFSYSLVNVVLVGPRLRLPIWLSYVGWILLIAPTYLLIRSLFLEIPFRETYVAGGVGASAVKTGTYALVRHPGVLWFGLILAALVLASRSRLLLIATPIWTGLDTLYAWLQERYFLEQVFPDYEQYKKETPMLIPTRASVIRCWQTIRNRRVPAKAEGTGDRKGLEGSTRTDPGDAKVARRRTV